MASNAEFLVDARWFAAHRNDANLVILDTRAPKDFWAGHLAGARNFDPFPFHYSESSERGINEFKDQLRWIFSALGITTRHAVLCYENDSGMRATRVAWALEWMGHPNAKILDGGLKALAAEKLVTEVKAFAPIAYDGTPIDDASASLDYVVGHIADRGTQIFDVRSDAEYYSERVRAKHGGAIPSAIHLDWTASQDASGAFKSADELRAQFAKLGLHPENEVIPYCQGGYRAAHAYYALRLAGFPRVRNYWGSWGEWGNRDDTPIEHIRRRQ
ncbi:MAG TPA: rhodanese-like domain-containing protein [Candidatus Binataceae bacterium]|nr:rhodanese-like domain-containing protein [Candidatus Binataceae bacterium]